MREPLDWVKRLLRDEQRSDVLALLTPEVARERGPVVRLAVVGLTALGLTLAGTVALGSLAALLAAIGILYFLSTQVLGLKLNIDPVALYDQVKRQAAYGPN